MTRVYDDDAMLELACKALSQRGGNLIRVLPQTLKRNYTTSRSHHHWHEVDPSLIEPTFTEILCG